MVGNKGGKQHVLSQRKKTDRLLSLIHHRLTGWIWISFQPWTEKQVSQKDHLVGLGSVGVYSSLVCPHSFHILHILLSKCAANCRPPFSLCSTDEKKVKYKKEPVKCSRWDLMEDQNTFIAPMKHQKQTLGTFQLVSKKVSVSFYEYLNCGKGPFANQLMWISAVCLLLPITVLNQVCPFSDSLFRLRTQWTDNCLLLFFKSRWSTHLFYDD